MGRVEAVEQNRVEAAGRGLKAPSWAVEPPAGSKQYSLLLAVGDAFGCAAKARIGTQSDFDEHDVAVIDADQVDLATTAADVACDDAQAVHFQMACSQIFGHLAACLRRCRAGVDNAADFFGYACRASACRHLHVLARCHPGAASIAMNSPISLPDHPLSSTSSLYVVATPLGNIADMSLRAIAVLKAVDVIAAEDTRHSQRLLDAFGVTTRMLAVHQHNEQEAAGKLIGLLEAGQQVALITDAGTPAVSDPGARLVSRVREAGIPVVPVPGACAAIAALSVSGFAERGFRFVGFLPPKSAARIAALQPLRDVPDAMVFYEAPHRIVECVADLARVFGGEREVLIAREMTKLHEQVVRMPLADTAAWFAADSNRSRGEFVLVLAGQSPSEGLDAEAERVLCLLLDELPVKTAVKLAAEISGASKNALYARALTLRDARD